MLVDQGDLFFGESLVDWEGFVLQQFVAGLGGVFLLGWFGHFCLNRWGNQGR